MRILLTGGTGFVGQALVARLVANGHELFLLIRETSITQSFTIFGEKVVLIRYNGEIEDLSKNLSKLNLDLVVHLASLFISEHNSVDVDPLIESNIIMPLKLLESMDYCGVKLFLNTGTSWQHFKGKDYNPVNLYSSTKQAFEDILTYYIEAKSFKAITLKLFDTYGPGDNRKKLFYWLRKSAIEKSVLNMSPGDQLLDLLYIDDIVDAYIIAIDCLFNIDSSKIYFVSNNNRITLKDVVLKYEQVTGHRIRVNWGNLCYRQREVMAPINAIEILPNWEPKVTLEEGISKMERQAKRLVTEF